MSVHADRSLAHIIDLLARVVPRIEDTVRVLHERSGEMKGSVSGAAPSSGSGVRELAPGERPDLRNGLRRVLNTKTGEWEEEAELSKVEADGTVPDFHRVKLARLDELLERIAADLTEVLVASMPAPLLLPPSTARRHQARALRLLWLATNASRARRPKCTDRRVVRARLLVEELANLVDSHRPAVKAKPIEPMCQAHERAKLSAEVDPRYRGMQLCRWCGLWRAEHGEMPPVKFVELHDRGIRITPSMRAEHAARLRRRTKR